MKNFILKAFDLMTKVTRWLVIIAAVSIAALMVLNFTDIVGTKFFSMSIPGALDISEELMVLLTLLPFAYIALERGHIRITLLVDHLPSAVCYALEILQYILAALITGFVTVRAFVQMQREFETMTLKTGIDLPTWPGNFVTVIAFGFLTLVWVLLLVKTLVVKPER
jgi:TRAP-type transport system small permease protein